MVKDLPPLGDFLSTLYSSQVYPYKGTDANNVLKIATKPTYEMYKSLENAINKKEEKKW